MFCWIDFWFYGLFNYDVCLEIMNNLFVYLNEYYIYCFKKYCFYFVWWLIWLFRFLEYFGIFWEGGEDEVYELDREVGIGF